MPTEAEILTAAAVTETVTAAAVKAGDSLAGRILREETPKAEEVSRGRPSGEIRRECQRDAAADSSMKEIMTVPA